MKLVLHIGRGKTGTTSIQTGLTRAAPALLARGILYPVMDRRKDHNLLVSPFKSAVNRRMLHRHGSEQAISEAARKQFRKTGDLVAKFKPHTLVLSAEFLFDNVNADAFMQRLHQAVPGIEEVVLAAYLRQPSSHYLSWLQQSLKTTHKIGRPERQQIAAALKQWKPLGRLQLREFATSQLVDGDALRDFWHHFLPSEVCPYGPGEVRANTSLSAESLWLLRNYILSVWPNGDAGVVTDSDRLVRRLKALEASGRLTTTRPRLYDDLAQYLDAPGHDLDELRKLYGFEFAALAGISTCRMEAGLPDRSFGKIADIMAVDIHRLHDLRDRFAATWCIPGSASWRQNRRIAGLLLGNDV